MPCLLHLYLRLLFILSNLFFKSSILAAAEEGEARVVPMPEEWVWLESRSRCWYCSRDSRSWESLLCSISVEDATVGSAGLESRDVRGGLSSCCREKKVKRQDSGKSHTRSTSYNQCLFIFTLKTRGKGRTNTIKVIWTDSQLLKSEPCTKLTPILNSCHSSSSCLAWCH